MKRFLRRCLIVLSGALLALGAVGVSPAQAATYNGGVDLRGLCQSYDYQDAKLIGSTAYDWRCVDHNGGLHGIDMHLACSAHQYNAIARVANFYDPNSWQCWTSASLLGGMDLNGYCRFKNYDTARPIGTTAYDWRCVTSSGALVGIDTPSVCKWQYSGWPIDRFDNFYDRNSWQCWS
jgi:hypothetical protein